MKTQAMQERLDHLMSTGQIEKRSSYNIMPSDCRGDGMDIAMVARCDESGDYMVCGILCRVTCSCRVGSRNWSDGIPAGYRLEIDPQAPYTLQPGETAYVVDRTGTKIGMHGFLSRFCSSIYIRRVDGSKVYHGHTPYWLGNTSTYASHYKSGLSRRDEQAWRTERSQLEATAAQINATAEKPV